jgi:RimJ/RimL family protein N-acetyltransferase
MLMKYTASYKERVVLDDGAILQLRAIRPSDKAALSDGFQRLSAQSRRQRFLSAKSSLSEDDLRHLTECDGVDDYAIVAMRSGNGRGQPEIIGVARYSRLAPGSNSAEIAITVVDEWQRRGVGRKLLKRIVMAASEHGIERVDGVALADNQQILKLLAPHASDISKNHEDGLIHFTCDVPPAEEPGRLEDLYALLRMVAEGTLLVPLRMGLGPLVQVLAYRKSTIRPFGEDTKRAS